MTADSFTPVMSLLTNTLDSNIVSMGGNGPVKKAEICVAVLESLADVVTVHDLADNGRLIFANKAALRHFGTELATLTSWPSQRICPYEAFRSEDGASLPDGEFLRFETEHVVAANERIPVEMTLTRVPHRGQDYLFCHTRDLRPQRDMEAHAMRLEKRALAIRLERDYKDIYDNLNDGIFLLDVSGGAQLRIASCNRAAERQTGFLESEIVGKPVEDVFPQARVAWLERLLGQCLKNGETVSSNDVTEHDGDWLQIDSVLIPLRDPYGIIQRIVWVSRDVTEQRRLELAEQTRAREFRLLVERSPDIVARYDADCRRIYANPTMVALCGEDAPLIGTRPEEYPGGETGRLYEQCLRLVLGHGEDRQFELCWNPIEQGVRYTLVRLSAERNSAGEVVGVLAVGRDITERKRQESQEVARAEIFDRLSAGDELDGILAKVVQLAELPRPGLIGSVLLPGPTGSSLSCVVAPTLPDGFLRLIDKTPTEEGDGTHAVTVFQKTELFVENLARQKVVSDCNAVVQDAGLRACWLMPILDGGGDLLGTFAFFRRQSGLPDVMDISIMRQACQTARLVIERHRENERIHHQANYDSLTGLYNRNALSVRLTSIEAGDQFALLYLDVDNFKEINDTLGHIWGDRLLKQIAYRLRDTLPTKAAIARMSGDEFVVVHPDFGGIYEIEQLAEKVRQSLTGEYVLGPNAVWISVSVGVSLYPEQTKDTHELLSFADQALYAAKMAGRNCVRLFDQAMLDKTRMRVRLAADLRVALQEGQMSLYYQPIYKLADGQALKAEALLRWCHPEFGWVSPAVFIPIAEEIGIIHEIGDWVFSEAARVALDWNNKAPTDGPYRVGINRSPNQFFGRRGVDGWLGLMASEGIPGEFLDVEITEGLLLDDRPEVLGQLRQLRARGVTVSLDDFGTGYSALSYLKKFEIDCLKIDHSFVRDIASDPSDRAIVESIIAMAKRLNIKLIAEGVEIQEQAELLTRAGCDMAQGYLFAKPMPEAEFLSFLTSGSPVAR